MKLKIDVVGKDNPFYYARRGVRDGKRVSAVTVISFGRESDLLKITDDPYAYCRQKADEYEREHTDEDYDEKIKFDPDSRLPTDNSLNVGYFFLQSVMNDLKLREFFDDAKKDRRMKYESYDILRFLVYARVIDPDSKLHTQQTLGTYFEKPDFGYQPILRFMDFLEEHHDEYLTWLYRKSGAVVNRDTSVMYYDCTNFYCEKEEADDDYVDPVTGEVIQGLRKFGISKEHRPNPIVEMGLYTDRDGIPITMGIYPGNRQETTTAVPLENEVIKMLKPGTKFIYCADAGLGTYNIRQFNSLGGRAFVVTQSVKKLSDALQEAVFNDCGYRLLSDGQPVSLKRMTEFDLSDEANAALYGDRAYKIFCADKSFDCGLYDIIDHGDWTEKRKSRDLLPQTIIVTYSRQLMEYQRYIRNGQIERAKNRIKNCNPETIKKGPNDVNRFIKAVKKDKDGNRIDTKYELDTERIADEEKYDGFYAIATNLTDDNGEEIAWDIATGRRDHPRKEPGNDFVKEILKITGQRYQIEDCFRILKSELAARPIYHFLPKRISAHFLICYTALLVQKLLMKKLSDNGTPVTISELADTLKRLKVANIKESYYSLYGGGETLKNLINLTNLELDKVKYRPSTLHNMIRKLLH